MSGKEVIDLRLELGRLGPRRIWRRFRISGHPEDFRYLDLSRSIGLAEPALLPSAKRHHVINDGNPPVYIPISAWYCWRNEEGRSDARSFLKRVIIVDPKNLL